MTPRRRIGGYSDNASPDNPTYIVYPTTKKASTEEAPIRDGLVLEHLNVTSRSR